MARLKFALAFLREPQRWSMAGLAVVLGTIGLILADGFIERIFTDFREVIVRAHFGHVQVLPAENLRDAGPGNSSLARVRTTVESALLAYPGAVVTARLSFVGLVALGDRTVSFIGEGVEPDNERTLSSALVIDRGESLTSDDSGAVLLGEGLAGTLGAEVGERLTLLVNTPGGGVNALEAGINGIFYSATKAYDDRALRLPLTTAQRLLRSDEVSRLIVVLPRSEDSKPAASRLEDALQGQPVEVKHWSELADFYNKTVRLFSSQLAVVRAVIVAIVLLSVTNTLARNVLERSSEIGTMLALGRTRAAVARLFLFEGLVIGIVGGAAGVLLGWMLAGIVSAVGIPMPPPPGMARGFVGGIEFTPAIAALAFSIAVLTAVAAALLPAVRASRANVVDALRVGR